MLMNCHLRTLLPSVKLLKPSRIKKSKRPYKLHCDKGAKDLPPIDKGQSVSIHNKSDWSRKGLVIDKAPHSTSIIFTLQLIRAPLQEETEETYFVQQSM